MSELQDITVQAPGLADRALRIFRSEGTLVVKGFLPDRVVRAVARYLEDALVELDALFQRYGFSWRESDAAVKLTELVERDRDSLPEKHRHIFLGHFPREVRLADALREIPHYANTQPLLFELLRTRRLFVHMPPTARFVLPRCTLARVPPHQDISYNKHIGEFCVLWVPLVPIDAACGGMAVYPGTHRKGEVLSDTGGPASEGWLRPIEGQDIGDTPRVVLAPLEPGDIVVLGHKTIHESMPNQSDRVRLSVDFRFFGERSRSSKHYLELETGVVVPPPTPVKAASHG